MDASVRAIPRPNYDTLYVLSLLDLGKDAVVNGASPSAHPSC
jgi:hypothetical protein